MTDYETAYRDLVAGLEALADKWVMAGNPHANPIRALLASSPAEGTGEAGARWCTRGHAQTDHLHDAGPCKRPHADWSGAQCDCRRFGEMALTRHAREVAAELKQANDPPPAPVSSGEACPGCSGHGGFHTIGGGDTR